MSKVRKCVVMQTTEQSDLHANTVPVNATPFHAHKICSRTDRTSDAIAWVLNTIESHCASAQPGVKFESRCTANASVCRARAVWTCTGIQYNDAVMHSLLPSFIFDPMQLSSGLGSVHWEESDFRC